MRSLPPPPLSMSSPLLGSALSKILSSTAKPLVIETYVGAGADPIVARPRLDDIQATQANDHVGSVSTDQGVVSIGADDGGRHPEAHMGLGSAGHGCRHRLHSQHHEGREKGGVDRLDCHR